MRARVMNGYWVFQAPHGYKYERVTGRGQMLKRHEPVASIVQEALEGYASGRFELQADVMPSVIATYEARIRKLEAETLLIEEKLASAGRPASTFGDTLRTVLGFLSNP